MGDLTAYADALGIKPARGNPPPGSGIVAPDQQRPDTHDGSPGDIAELQQAIASAPDAASKQTLTALLQQKTAKADQTARLSPYAKALGLDVVMAAAQPAPVAQVTAQQPPRGYEAGGIPNPSNPNGWRPIQGPAETVGDIALGAGEAGLNAVTGATTGAIGGILGAGNALVRKAGYALGGVPETPDLQGNDFMAHAFDRGAQAGTYQPRTDAGQRYVESAVAPAMQNLMAAAPVLHTATGGLPMAKQAIVDKAAAVLDRSPAAARAAFDASKRVEPTMGEKPTPQQIEAQAVKANEPIKTQPADTGPLPSLGFKLSPDAVAHETAIAGSPRGGLQPEQLTQRADVLARVLPGAKIRKSVLEGDLNAAAGDFEMARLAKADDAGAIVLKNAIDAERAGLQKFADETVQKVGGAKGLDEQSLQSKGASLANPIDGAIQEFNKQTRELYRVADEQAAGLPSTPLKSFADILNTEHNFAGKAEKVQLSNGVRSYMKAMKLVNDEGAIQPMTPKQAEGLRQYINSEYGPQTKGVIGQMVRAIDEDVAQGAGEVVHQAARAMFRQKKELFDNPQGIAKLFDFDPETPINRKTALEKIPDTFMNLPLEQQGHIVDVFNNKMPTPELQKMASEALETIRSHALERLDKAGSSTKSVWNQKAIVKEMDANSGTYRLLFKDNPEILQRLQDMRDVGHMITAEDKSYGGAAVQERTLLRRGAEKIGDTVRSSGPAAVAGLLVPVTSGGSTLVMPAAVGLGRKWADSAKASRSLKDAESRLTTIKGSDFPGMEPK